MKKLILIVIAALFGLSSYGQLTMKVTQAEYDKHVKKAIQWDKTNPSSLLSYEKTVKGMFEVMTPQEEYAKEESIRKRKYEKTQCQNTYEYYTPPPLNFDYLQPVEVKMPKSSYEDILGTDYEVKVNYKAPVTVNVKKKFPY